MNNESTYDEREALIEKIRLAGHLSAQVMVFQGDTYPVKAIPYTSFLHILDGFRRSEVPEPSARFVPWTSSGNTVASTGANVTTQGEPSDAQKISEAITRASVRGVEFMDQGEGPGDAISLSDIFLAGFASAIDAVREELRSAGGAR